MNSVTLKVTSAFLVGGALARPGELVEVTVSEAKDLLARGKAELATVEHVSLTDEGNIPADEPAEPEPQPKRKRSR